MVLGDAVDGTYLVAAFEPADLCLSQHVWQGAKAMEEHRDKLDDKDNTKNDDKRHTNRL